MGVVDFGAEVRGICACDGFRAYGFWRSELRALRAPDGAPLWDGQAELVVRDATEEEKSAWEAEVEVAIREREIDRREDALDMSWFIFLVPYLEPDE